MEDEDKMPYQVKSTPFFRRMVSISKKNGQLQRLKEEYERMMEFNDRTIEMKIPQVRLKRLFSEIEEIEESSSQWKRRRIAADRSKTNKEIRAKQRWRKLALIVRERFGTFGQRNMLPLVDNQEHSSEECELREISNDTHLTTPPNSESDLLPGEVLLSVESLDSLEMQSLPDPNTTASGKLTADEGSGPKGPLRKVQQYVKMFEPIVRDVKEVLEFGIEKLRNIFKHQNVEQ